MAIEVELKLVVASQSIATLTNFLSQWASQYHGQQRLQNCYYDTVDNYLQRHNMGLRIRDLDGRYEMTLKKEGKTVAGLSQRPEYNVALIAPVLALDAFPMDVWPMTPRSLIELQQQLQPLFLIDFIRKTWLITYQDSQIEFALDQGSIEVADRKELISEIELELKQGNINDLLAFAHQISFLGGLRLAGKSKAARGYCLQQGYTDMDSLGLTILPITGKITLEQGLEKAIEIVLIQWQHHEELWLLGDLTAKKQIDLVLLLLQQVWQVWGGIISRKATSALRDNMTKLSQLMALSDDSEAICYNPLYLQSKLGLMKWLMNKDWRTVMSAKSIEKLATSFKRFADITLSRKLAELKTVFVQRLVCDEYQDQIPRLERQIVGFYLLAGAYPKAQSQPYINCWQALLNAIIGQQQSQIDTLRKAAIEQPVFWLNSAQIKSALP